MGTSGNRRKLVIHLVFCTFTYYKNGKVEFFQIPSCKFENIASGVYSHPNSAPHAPLMLTNLKVYIYSFLNSVVMI